ncbi:hypothetical protein EBR56_10745, partial [bacterium]|nr:hypothetical protein [bacterium]
MLALTAFPDNRRNVSLLRYLATSFRYRREQPCGACRVAAFLDIPGTSRMPASYRFSVGPWNLGQGGDPFGPPVRPAVPFDAVLDTAVSLGFEGIQFHDDDAVPDLESLAAGQIVKAAEAMRRKLADKGLVAEFVAPRLWEHARGIDGGYTSNDPTARTWAIERSKRAVDVAAALGTDLIVMWPAREGTA